MLFQHLSIKDMFLKYHTFHLFVENRYFQAILSSLISLYQPVHMLRCLPAVILSTSDAFVGMRTQNYELAYSDEHDRLLASCLSSLRRLFPHFKSFKNDAERE